MTTNKKKKREILKKSNDETPSKLNKSVTFSERVKVREIDREIKNDRLTTPSRREGFYGNQYR